MRSDLTVENFLRRKLKSHYLLRSIRHIRRMWEVEIYCRTSGSGNYTKIKTPLQETNCNKNYHPYGTNYSYYYKVTWCNLRSKYKVKTQITANCFTKASFSKNGLLLETDWNEEDIPLGKLKTLRTSYNKHDFTLKDFINGVVNIVRKIFLGCTSIYIIKLYWMYEVFLIIIEIKN